MEKIYLNLLMLQIEQVKPPLNESVTYDIVLHILSKKQIYNRKQVDESQRDRCLGCKLKYENYSHTLTFFCLRALNNSY